ncbi:MAG TPA: RNA methyltransferase [Acidimicrobiales bacterium]|nr:RNA methyltransferase [Acidimicrobiales bacterium]
MRRLRRLLRQRSYRRAERAFVAEGANLVGAALEAGAPVEAVYYAPEALDQPSAARLLAEARRSGVRCFGLARGVLERVADAVTPQPICAVVAALDVPLERLAPADVLLVCVGVRDPGNLGAIVRSADAAGCGGVVCCGEGADPYNPKAVRSSAGSIFHVPLVLAGEARAALGELAAAGFCRVATRPSGAPDYATAPLAGRVALVLGSEAAGLPDELGDCFDAAVSIPMRGRAESLNVAMAATVLCFELARRERLAGAAGHLR